MGVVNVTPDSFSDGGLHFDRDQAVEYALQLLRDGADIIDVGGESTRPGTKLAPVAGESKEAARPSASHKIAVTEKEELDRVIPVITALKEEAAGRTDLSGHLQGKRGAGGGKSRGRDCE